MATAEAQLTPTADATPAPASVTIEKEVSGAGWVDRFPTNKDIDDCKDPFKGNLQSFVDALKAAGATVVISATYRPPERAYLMHWCWMIAKKDYDPQKVPVMDGVNIQWDHTDSDGKYSKSDSVQGAKAMVNAYGMQALGTAPALNSRHTAGCAVDMNISWSDTLKIKNASDETVEIKSAPRTGMNTDLHAVGKSYGVIKFFEGEKDKPHWSDNGI